MRATADPPRSFEPVDQHGDRPGGQGEPGAQFPLRQRSRGFEVLERVRSVGLMAAPLASAERIWWRARPNRCRRAVMISGADAVIWPEHSAAKLLSY